jgi:hypothetical protein
VRENEAGAVFVAGLASTRIRSVQEFEGLYRWAGVVFLVSLLSSISSLHPTTLDVEAGGEEGELRTLGLYLCTRMIMMLTPILFFAQHRDRAPLRRRDAAQPRVVAQPRDFDARYQGVFVLRCVSFCPSFLAWFLFLVSRRAVSPTASRRIPPWCRHPRRRSSCSFQKLSLADE